MLTLPRSGSEVLVECLDSHPDIQCDGEVLLPYLHNRDLVAKKLKVFFHKQQKINEKRPIPKKVICFKSMYMHLDEKAWRFLLKEKIKIIHLIRKNQFERAISDEFNHRKNETGRRAHSKDKEKIVNLFIDKEKLSNQIVDYNNMVKNMEFFLKEKNVDYISIYYEDLFSDADNKIIDTLPISIQTKICNFFEILSRPMSTTLVKQNPPKLSDCVYNWKEIRGLNNFKKRSLFDPKKMKNFVLNILKKL